MRKQIRAVNWVAAACGNVVILCSPWNSLGCFIYALLLLVGLFGLMWLNVSVVWLVKSEFRKDVSVRELAIAPALVCITGLLLHVEIPRRIAFHFSREQFDRCLPTAAASNSENSTDQWLGLYHVDRCAADSRGGVFFRIGVSPGMDTESYGFVYRPNRQGTPFGHSYYVLQDMGGGWYWFDVVDRF